MFRTFDSRLLALLIIAIWSTMAASDLYVPTMPLMAKYYNTTDDWLNLTVSANLLCFPLAGIFYGPLSDSFGRRPVVLAGMTIFTVGCLICAFIPSLPVMIFGRFIQGLGACVADILSLAMIRDRYTGNKSAKMISVLEIYIVISPTVPPLIGGFVAQYFGWQFNFSLILLMTLMATILMYFYLPETLKKEKRHPFCFADIWQTYIQILKNKVFIGYALVSGFVFGGLYTIIVGMPYLYVDVFKFSVVKFTLYLIAGVVAYIIATEINRRLVEKYGMKSLLWFGVKYFALIGILNFIVAIVWPTDPEIIRIVSALYIFFMGFTIANSAAIAMETFPRKAGAAAAVILGIEMLTSTVGVTLTGWAYESTFLQLAAVMLFFSMGSYIICFGVRKLDGSLS